MLANVSKAATRVGRFVSRILPAGRNVVRNESEYQRQARKDTRRRKKEFITDGRKDTDILCVLLSPPSSLSERALQSSPPRALSPASSCNGLGSRCYLLSLFLSLTPPALSHRFLRRQLRRQGPSNGLSFAIKRSPSSSRSLPFLLLFFCLLITRPTCYRHSLVHTPHSECTVITTS